MGRFFFEAIMFKGLAKSSASLRHAINKKAGLPLLRLMSIRVIGLIGAPCLGES